MNDMPDIILLEALDLMEQGMSIDDNVARYPDQAADLWPFLNAAAALPSLAVQPSVTAERDSRQAFLAEADRMAAEAARPRRAGGLWRLLAPALAVLAVLFLGGAGLARVSASAVPGDAFYQTKRFIEQPRLNLTNAPERAAALREQFRLERIDEIERLLNDSREADVSLTGVIVAMTGDEWTVDGVPVVVPAGATIEGVPFVGALVRVDGRTEGGTLVASAVTLLSGTPPPLPTPEFPAPTPTQPLPTPMTPASTAEPLEPAPGAQPVVPVATAAPTQPPQPPPPPTATPSFDDNDNDDFDDDFDDDDNDNDDFGGDGGDDDDSCGSGGDDGDDDDDDGQSGSDNDSDSGGNDDSSGDDNDSDADDSDDDDDDDDSDDDDDDNG